MKIDFKKYSDGLAPAVIQELQHPQGFNAWFYE